MSDIELKYKWDLTKFCKSCEDCETKLKEVSNEVKDLLKYKGTLNEPKNLLAYWQDTYKLYDKMENCYVYAFANLHTDFGSQIYNELSQKAESVQTLLNSELSFAEAEIKILGKDYLQKLLNMKEFLDWRQVIELNIARLEHTLTEKEEKILAFTNEIGNGFTAIKDSCCNTDIKFEDALDSKGISHKVTEGNMSGYFKSQDRVLRKNVSISQKNALEKYSYTLTSNFIYHIKFVSNVASLRGFKSVLDSTFLGSKMTKDVFDNIINCVDSHQDILTDILKTKKKISGYDTIYNYDLYLDMDKSNKVYTFEEGIDIVKKATSILGEDYVKLIDRAVEERWIDVYPAENKMSGGYCWGTYGKTHIVLLNWTGTLDDVFTLAHELGHAIQHYLMDKKHKVQEERQYMYFEETASLFNEVILSQYLLEQSIDEKEKLGLLDEKCTKIMGTMFRQTEFSKFENYCYDTIFNGGQLTRETLIAKWRECRFLPYESVVDMSNFTDLTWQGLWHFFALSYYVWQYSFAFMIAQYFAGNILSKQKDAVSKYFDFISTSGCEYPLDLMKRLGADITSKDFYENAFKYFRKNCDEYMDCAEKFFKK